MTVVTIGDVEIALGRSLTATEEARTFQLLQTAEARFEDAFPGFSIATGTETVRVVPPASGVLWTPKYPVTAVDAVTIDDQALTADRFTLKGEVFLDVVGVDRTFELNLMYPGWNVGTWEVTYDFGLDPLPASIVGAIAEMVANLIRSNATNPDNVQTEMLGAYQVSYGDFAQRQAFAGMHLSEDHLAALKRWSRTRAVAARLR